MSHVTVSTGESMQSSYRKSMCIRLTYPERHAPGGPLGHHQRGRLDLSSLIWHHRGPAETWGVGKVLLAQPGADRVCLAESEDPWPVSTCHDFPRLPVLSPRQSLRSRMFCSVPAREAKVFVRPYSCPPQALAMKNKLNHLSCTEELSKHRVCRKVCLVPTTIDSANSLLRP